MNADPKRANKTNMDPSFRMKQLIEMSHNITVERSISISKYFKSGRELLKSAAAFADKGDIEKAFVLYLRYMTLFLEKITLHPEYREADGEEKALVKKECNRAFEHAEDLKKRILEKYQKEYELAKTKHTDDFEADHLRQKRTVGAGSSAAANCDIEEIDRKFNFTEQPVDNIEEKAFDPFNIEELRLSFDNRKQT